MIKKPDGYGPFLDLMEDYGFDWAREIVVRHCRARVSEVTPLAIAYLRGNRIFASDEASSRHGGEEYLKLWRDVSREVEDEDGVLLCNLLLEMSFKERRIVIERSRIFLDRERQRERDEITGSTQPVPSGREPVVPPAWVGRYPYTNLSPQGRSDPWVNFRWPDPMTTYLMVDGVHRVLSSFGRRPDGTPFVLFDHGGYNEVISGGHLVEALEATALALQAVKVED
jgi:hypothetical protein